MIFWGVPWLGEVNLFLVLTIGIVILTVRMLWRLLWRLSQWLTRKLTDTDRARSSKPSTDVLNARNLSLELETVTANWYQLGINLGLQTHDMNKIERDYHGSDHQMLQTLDLWLRRTSTPSWVDVIHALQKMGENRVAESIRQKYFRAGYKISHFSHEDSDTEGIIRNNKRKIVGKFAMLVKNTCRKLRERPINFEDLQTFLTSYFSPGECIPKSANINEIFNAISRHDLWDYWNYYPLEEIVQGFAADDQEILSWIETYRHDLESYKVTTKLLDHIAADSVLIVDELEPVEQPARHDRRYYQKLSFKLKMDFTDHSLKYIDEFWNKFASLYGLPPYVVLLDHIRKGCISIVWLVPSHLAPKILSGAPLSDDFYQKHEIVRVEFDGECIYQEKEDHKEKVSASDPLGPEEREKMSQLLEGSSEKETVVGYDCEFVDPPPPAFQTECPICRLVLHEPYIVSCCGTNFCHTCIKPLQAEKSPCPTCRKDFEVFPNKGLKYSLNELHVCCTHRRDGCKWTGGLVELNNHLKECPNRNPSPTQMILEEIKQDDEEWCSPPFYTHPQGYEMYLRVDANSWGDSEGAHVLMDSYLMRGEFVDPPPTAFQTECPMCEVVLCEPYLVSCCGTNFCHTCILPLQVNKSPCPICRKDFEVFSNKGLKRSLNQLHVYCTDGCEWRGELAELNKHLKECPIRNPFPIKRTLTNFQEVKHSKEQWYSPPFYTHPQGYKMRLRVDANGWGDGEGTHVSVGAYLMRGSFDDHLKWPFRGSVVIQLCNQLEDKKHCGHTINFIDTTDPEVISRVASEEKTEVGLGTPTFIAHNELEFNSAINCQYLKNDCLLFRIVTVESLSEPGVLPTELTMTNFEQHKIDSDYWFSSLFYTHLQGYKMCLCVYANGYDEGKGTHVSVGAYLMKGEFDDHLKWPFQGSVVVQLSNQVEDRKHHGHIINFDKTADPKTVSKVTSGEMAEGGLGTPTLIAHNELNFNSANNCQYLKNDCLHFRIITVDSLSEPGVFPTELTMTNFEQHKIDNDDWLSPPFYTHPQGYKMCLSVNANGIGTVEGTHVSIYVYLMRGEFDDHLKWPFQGNVLIQLCNMLEDQTHRGHTIDFCETTDAKATSRVISGMIAKSGSGIQSLIAHNDLDFNAANNCQYLKHDSLHFRIVTVESLSEPGVLPTELTMTNFQQHKINSDSWFSPPFYTHPRGYKMCLNVDANGWGDGEGTHVSVFAYLMRGEFDDHLKWPFQGLVTVAILNHLEDSNHITKIIRFTDTTDSSYVGRVTDGQRALGGWGYKSFIAHRDLNKPAKNHRYLKYDCLRFQIITECMH